MILRATLAFLALPAMVAGLVPWLISELPGPVLFQSSYGAALFAMGAGILLASALSFYRRGKGTLAPWDPPKHLVVADLYRFNRNPMYAGVALANIGWALCTGNPWNYGYAILVPIVFHLRVVFYEEKEMARLFGPEWNAYRHAVPRWGIARHPYTPGAKPDGTARNAP